jgi:hypothetical protein
MAAQPVTVIITVNGEDESMRAEMVNGVSGYKAHYDARS